MGPKTSAGKKKPTDKQPPVDEKFGSVEVTTTNVNTVLLLVSSPELGIVCKACEALLNYMQKSENHILEVMELGGVTRFIPLLSSQDRAARCHGILCINCMIQLAPIRTTLFKTEGFLAAVINLVQPDEELHTVERATNALSQLAGDFSFKLALGRLEAHKPLMPFLQSADPDIQRNSVKTINMLLEDFQQRDSFHEEGGVPELVKLLSSEYAIIQDLALQSLRSCMHHGPSREALAGGEDLAKLVEFLGDKKSTDLHVLGVEVLGLCLYAADSMTILHSSGLLQQLLTYITDSNDPNMKKQATLTLARIATDALSRKILHETQCEKTFIQLLAIEEIGLLEAACVMLGNMAELSTSQLTIGAEGGVTELVQHFSSEEDSLRVALILCLSKLVHECPSNSRLLAESAGGLEALVTMLSDKLASCRQLAAECVLNVCIDESIRQRLLADEVVMPLLECVSFEDYAVQATGAKALGMLATDQAARQQIHGSGGIDALLKLLQSSNREVVKNVLWTLTVCAQNTQIAEDIGKLGGIEKLQLIASSEDQLCSSLAYTCQNKLLDFNLPAKYWVTHKLDYTDHIVNMEFYDAGPAYSKHTFKSLSELAQLPFTSGRPILAVNLISKHVPVEEPVPLETSTTRVSSPSSQRGRSRQQGTRSKRNKAERDVESRTSEDNELTKTDSKSGLTATVLEPDKGLIQHCQHVQSHVQTLEAVADQVKELARYVSDQMGGPVKHSAALCYELSAAHLQTSKQSNFIPIGELQQGSFQHRALLFKVLCDSLGIGSSLVRGTYGRHWNEVSVKEEEDDEPCVHLVDLMFQPGSLYKQHSPKAIRYQQI